MYSRYTPNASGGFDRRQLPDASDLRAAQGRPPPADPEAVPLPPPQTLPKPIPSERVRDQRPGPGNHAPMRFRPGPGSRIPPPGGSNRDQPVGAQRAPAPPPVFGTLTGVGGLLSQLLPHGLDSEDLLILAILLLSMKQDGADPTELLIAVGLYFWL